LKILLLSTELPPEHAAGIATYIATIAPALAARGHDVHVLSCSPGHSHGDEHDRGVWWHRRPTNAADRVFARLRHPQVGLRVAAMTTTARELKRLMTRFDVIEVPEWMAQGLLLRTQGTPIVVSLHSPLHILCKYNDVPMDRDRRVADRLERLQVERATAVTSASNLLTTRLKKEGWLRDRAETIRYPVDLASFATVAPVFSTPPNILYVGRLEARKAPETLVDAVSRLRAKVPAVEVTFFGSSNGSREGRPYGEWVQMRAQHLGVPARFVDKAALSDIGESFGKARVVAVSSRFESFSFVGLEAMAASRPVVCTSTTGVAELIDGHDAGVVVAPGDPDALAKALTPYLTDAGHAACAGMAARRLVEEQCDPLQIAEQREACYLTAAQQRGR